MVKCGQILVNMLHCGFVPSHLHQHQRVRRKEAKGILPQPPERQPPSARLMITWTADSFTCWPIRSTVGVPSPVKWNNPSVPVSPANGRVASRQRGLMYASAVAPTDRRCRCGHR
jgi:hypothetical protein